MTTLCANHSQQLVAVFLLTALAFAGCVQPQLQHAQHSQRSVLNEPTLYPAAGYRPKIPFHLPRQPKVLFPTFIFSSNATMTTTTTNKTPTSMVAPTEQIDINIETLDDETTTASISVPRIPANSYGTPSGGNTVHTDTDMNVNVDLLYETEVINAPTEHFQPPMPNAAKNFNTAAELNNTLDYIEENVTAQHHQHNDDLHKKHNDDDDGQMLVADVPAIADENLFSVEPQPMLNVFNKRFEFEQRQIPASTYGPTNPIIADMNTNIEPVATVGTFELELNESENELARILLPHTNTNTNTNTYANINGNSVSLSASNEALNRLSALKTGRLILLPADNADMRQIYLANFANIKRAH